MLANFHTHTVFCHGKNTPQQLIDAALEKGFHAIGFSSHGYTDFDLSYCMTDTEGYIAQIRQLQQRYRDRIRIYLGAEEDILRPVDRKRFDYIISSSHYCFSRERYHSLDSSPQQLRRCLEDFDGDMLRLAQTYYQRLCDYILKRKPDIIGHFDLITKFAEVEPSLFSNRQAYEKLAADSITRAAQSGCLFEVNTGAISRGLRTSPYPSEQLLWVLKKLDAGLILSSDCHRADDLDFGFGQMRRLLRGIGFTRLYTLDEGKFVPYSI